jgi:superfamily II DNA helicase RecQ
LTPEEMEERLKQLEKEIKELKAAPVQYYFNIDKVDINNPILEKLTFKLDAIDVKELSGALSIGNNFGVKVKKDKKSKSQLEKELEKLELFPSKKNKKKKKHKRAKEAEINKEFEEVDMNEEFKNKYMEDLEEDKAEDMASKTDGAEQDLDMVHEEEKSEHRKMSRRERKEARRRREKEKLKTNTYESITRKEGKNPE